MNPQLAAFLGLLRRYPYCAACTLALLLFAGGAWFLRGQIATLETEYDQVSKQGEKMLSLLVGGSTQRQELAFVHDTVRRMEDNLVVEANLAENLWYFFKLEEQTKARLPELHQLNSPPNDPSRFFRRVPYTLRVTGTFEQVAAFLLAIETGPRLARIISFSFSQTAGGTVLDLNLEVLGKK